MARSTLPIEPRWRSSNLPVNCHVGAKSRPGIPHPWLGTVPRPWHVHFAGLVSTYPVWKPIHASQKRRSIVQCWRGALTDAEIQPMRQG